MDGCWQGKGGRTFQRERRPLRGKRKGTDYDPPSVRPLFVGRPLNGYLKSSHLSGPDEGYVKFKVKLICFTREITTKDLITIDSLGKKFSYRDFESNKD